MDMDMKLIGSRIRAVRKMRNITARKVAEYSGITEESLMHIECGARKPSYQTILNIAECLDASLDYLSGRVEKPADLVPTPIIKEAGLSEKQADALLDAAKALAPVIKKLV